MHRYIIIWVRSQRCGCLVTCFCYQMIAKPGIKTATRDLTHIFVGQKGSISSMFILRHIISVCTKNFLEQYPANRMNGHKKGGFLDTMMFEYTSLKPISTTLNGNLQGPHISGLSCTYFWEICHDFVGKPASQLKRFKRWMEQINKIYLTQEPTVHVL